MISKKLVNEECTVLDAEGVIYFLSKKKKKVSKESEVPKGELYACKYEYTDSKGVYHAHWVVKKDNEIVYNSLDNSQCVKVGTIAKFLPFRKVA